MGGLSEDELITAAQALLSRRLPLGWSAELQPGLPGQPNTPVAPDLIIRSQRAGSQSSVLLEAKREFAPRDVQALTGSPLLRRLRDRAGQTPIMVIAPYLSPRTRHLLAGQGISSLDLTGNVWIHLDFPGLFIETQGAQRDPAGGTRQRGLRGAKAGAVARVLIDARPPYTGVQISRAARVNEGYASRILETLIDEGLIQRSERSRISDVDWPALIRRRALALTLFRPVGAYRYVARNGPRQTLRDLAGLTRSDDKRPPVVTGSFAAERLAVVAPPTQLVVYTMDRQRLAQDLGLFEVDSGADVILIRPENDIVYTNARTAKDSVRYAAPSQVAIDCLAGTGRMPAEGEAAVDWMQQNESLWRTSLDELIGARRDIG